jgi:hypothetical protein
MKPLIVNNFQSFNFKNSSKSFLCPEDLNEITPILVSSPSLTSFYGETTKRGIE